MKSSQFRTAQNLNQLKTVFEYLQINIATASMVATATGIPQKNICRYKRKLELVGKLYLVRKAICKETGFKAWYLTTNSSKFKSNNQLNLFKIYLEPFVITSLLNK